MSRTTRDTDARRRRAGVVLACVTTALAFNAGALALADQAAALATPALVAPSRDTRPALLLVAARAPVADSRSGPAPDVEKRSTATPAPAARSRPTQRTALPERLARTPVSGTEEVALRFFRLGELDEPAEPAADWSLDLAALDELGLDRIAFELLIDDRGEIIACSLAAPLGLAAEVREALETRLRQTRMRPAVRGGVRVASYRRIELYADAGDAAGAPPPGAPLILSSAIADR